MSSPIPTVLCGSTVSGESLDGKVVPSVAALLTGSNPWSEADLRVDFSIRARSVPTVSYVDVLRGDPAVLSKLKDKKILIGATALELGDRFNVPNGQVFSGVLLQALAVETILQGRGLRNSSEVVTLLGLGVIILLMIATWRHLVAGARIALLLGLAITVEVGAVFLQARLPFILDTSIFHAVIAAYVIATAVDEIELRGLVGKIAERRFQRVAMLLSDGLVCVDQSGMITVWNPGAVAIWGNAAEEMIGKPFSKIVAPGKCEKSGLGATDEFPLDIRQVPLGKAMELQGRRKNGEVFHFEACFSTWEGSDGAQYAAVLRDISLRKLELEKIQYLAENDTLTGLANRNRLQQSLSAKIDQLRTDPCEIAFLLLDLDKFKEVNDTLGHACGDHLLCTVASQLKDLVGDTAMIARMSGDEFAIVISDANVVERAETLCRRISETFNGRHFSVGGRDLLVNCSIGVACFPKDCASVQDLLANADLAMYRAKSSGRGRYEFYDHSIRSEIEARVQLSTELEQAVSKGEFELFYQPQFRLKDGKLVGAEALIRWRHPQRGLILPGSFMSVVNTTPIANTVAHWVMETACKQGRLWQLLGRDIRISINLSPSQFQSGDLAAAVSAILVDTGFSPALLELEVTENILLEDDEKALETFKRIRELGVNIALDDFGTGYASLNYLKKFPLNCLKIDQFFVRGLRPESNDAAIIEYTLNLSKLLGLSVIAEGIENQATVELLAGMGCEEGQGYFLAMPMPVAELERMFLSPSGVELPHVATVGLAANAA